MRNVLVNARIRVADDVAVYGLETAGAVGIHKGSLQSGAYTCD